MNIAFKHPEFLFFLFAILVPIIIHLFSFRRYKKVYFHNLHLIREIQEEQHRSKSKLTELLILFARICLIIFLVLTFAQPYIPYDNEQVTSSSYAVALYVDNSFSTQAESKQGVVLEVEKKQAQEIVSAYPVDTKFFLVTNDGDATEYYARSRDEVLQDIREIQSCSRSILLSDVCKKMNVCAEQSGTSLQCHFLSDMQKTTFDCEHFALDSTCRASFYCIQSEHIGTISIDSCFFETQYHLPSQSEKIFVTISNHSGEQYANLPISLYVNDTVRAVSSVSLEAEKTVTIPIEYSTKSSGVQSCRVSIEDYPIVYDNTYYFSYMVENQIRIADIYQSKPNEYVQTLCRKSSFFSKDDMSITAIDYSKLSQYQILILDDLEKIPSGLVETIGTLQQSGVTIVCVPSKIIDFQSYNSLLALYGSARVVDSSSVSTKIVSVDTQSSIYKGMFEEKTENEQFPNVQSYFSVEPSQNHAIITLQDGHPFLVEQSKRQSTLFLFAAILDRKNTAFVTSPLFMGVYNMLLSSSSFQSIATTIGNRVELRLRYLQDDAIHIENQQKTVDVIPQYRVDKQSSICILDAMQQIETAGNYVVTQKRSVLHGLSYNYDRRESERNFYTSDELRECIHQYENVKVFDGDSDISSIIQQENEGTPLWRMMLIIAILALLAEIVLIGMNEKNKTKNLSYKQ